VVGLTEVLLTPVAFSTRNAVCSLPNSYVALLPPARGKHYCATCSNCTMP